MLEAEYSLCSRDDKDNDFELKEHILAKSKARDDAKVSTLSKSSLFAIVHSVTVTLAEAQLEVEYGAGSLSELLHADKLKELKRTLDKCKFRLNPMLKRIGEQVVPFINFDGCVKGEVQVEKCTLFEFKGNKQCFPSYMTK